MTTETTFVLLFTIATAVAIAVRRLPIPYTVALVVAGLVLGSMRIVEAPHLTKDFLFALILPGLIFEAAFNLDLREFWRSRLAIGSLAFPGVIVAIVLTAAVVTPIMVGLGLDATFNWRHGLVFGALIAATDPIAVVALFKRLNVPHRLSTLVEGESLLNDGTSVVVFGLVVAAVSGAVSTPTELIVRFVVTVGGGALAGAVVGVAATQMTKRINEPMIEITLTVIAAYGAFVLAEQFHSSGVIATVVAGMLCGGYGWRVGMSAETRVAVDSFWDYATFALNSIVFLLMGFEVHAATLLGSWKEIVIAYAGALLGRLGVVFAVTTLLRSTGDRLPPGWTVVLTWGGLRGALSMVLALALPFDFPHRAQLITITFGVVVLSLLVQGLTMSSVLRWVGIATGRDPAHELERARGVLYAVDGSLDELARMERSHAAPPGVLATLRDRFERRRGLTEREMTELHIGRAELHADEIVRTVRHLLAVERMQLDAAVDAGTLGESVARELVTDVARRLARLETGDYTDPMELAVPLPADEPKGA